MKKIRREGDLVIKIGKEFTVDWESKLTKVLTVINIPAFVKFIPNGYVTKFIDGVDLQSDKPFKWRHGVLNSDYKLNEIQRQKVIKIFKDIALAGIKTNYTLADFTKRNIIIKGNELYLIDYDVIIEGKLPQDYINLFQKMLDYLKINYKFDGDLKKLYECFS